MSEHDTGGVSLVMAPHRERLVVYASLTCGCFGVAAIPSPLVLPDVIEDWFAVRRDLRQDWGVDGERPGPGADHAP